MTITSITTRNAVLLLAGAVFLQPFVSKTLNGEWGKYSTQRDAEAACELAEDKGEFVHMDYRGGEQWQSRMCRLNINHFVLIQREVRPYSSIPDWNKATDEAEVINRFYF